MLVRNERLHWKWHVTSTGLKYNRSYIGSYIDLYIKHFIFFSICRAYIVTIILLTNIKKHARIIKYNKWTLSIERVRYFGVNLKLFMVARMCKNAEGVINIKRYQIFMNTTILKKTTSISSSYNSYSMDKAKYNYIWIT